MVEKALVTVSVEAYAAVSGGAHAFVLMTDSGICLCRSGKAPACC